MGARMIAFNEPDTMQWKVETKEHSKQTDSFNCGVIAFWYVYFSRILKSNFGFN